MYLTTLSQRLQEFQSGLKTFQKKKKKKEEMDHENIPNSRQFSNSYT